MFSFFTRRNIEAAVRTALAATTTRTRLGVEVLEAREVPAVFTWQPVDQSTNWNAAKNWVDENKANAVPGLQDTVVFKAASNADVTVPDAVKVAGLQIKAGYTKTLMIEGDFEVTSSAVQEDGKISGGTFTFSGTTYDWSGGSRVGDDNLQVSTVISATSNLVLPHTNGKWINIEGATVYVEGIATCDNDEADSTSGVLLGSTGRFVVDYTGPSMGHQAQLIKDGRATLRFDDDYKFSESQLIIGDMGRAKVKKSWLEIRADYKLSKSGFVTVESGASVQVLGASVTTGGYIIAKDGMVSYSPTQGMTTTDNPVAQFNGWEGGAIATGDGWFTVGDPGGGTTQMKINGAVELEVKNVAIHLYARVNSMNQEGDSITFAAGVDATWRAKLSTELVNKGSLALDGFRIGTGGKLRNKKDVSWAKRDIELEYANAENGAVVIHNEAGATFTIGDHAKKIIKANGQQGTAILLNEGTLVKDPNAPKVKHDLDGIHYKDKVGATAKQNGSEFNWGNGNPPAKIDGKYALGNGGKVNFGTSLTVGATGVLTGNGTVFASQVFNFGIVAPGEDVVDAAWDGSLPAQNMTIVGDFTNGETGIISLGWRNGQGVTTVDKLTIQADETTLLGGNMTITLGSALQLVGTPSYLNPASTYTLFSFTGTRTGWFEVGTIAGIPTGWAFYYDPQTGVLRTAPPGGGGENETEF